MLIGVPASFELALTSRPYYRSSYVFVYRKDKGLNITSFDDPELKNLKIGAHLIGDDNANAPPVHALTKRGLLENVVGYTVYGDYAVEAPPANLIRAVKKGEVDLAIAWGPLAGYFNQRDKLNLSIVPVKPEIDLPYLPMVFEISLGVRRGEQEYLDRLEQALEQRKEDVDRVLQDFGVPVIERKSADSVRGSIR